MSFMTRPPQTNHWQIYHLLRGSYEIARKDDYALGTICIAHSQEDADILVNALNYWEANINE